MENQTSGGKILPVVVAIILTALIVGGSMFLWQQGRETKNVVNNAANPESTKITEPTIANEQSQTTELKVGPISLQNPQSIPTCETAERQLPAQDLQGQLGITSFLQNGYAMIDVCREGNDKVAFLLSKNEPNLLFKDTNTCLNDCDRVAFGTVDFAKKDVVVVLSQHRLGTHAEAYGQFCRIDTIVSSGLFADNLYLYCGSGESGGFTSWYNYSFGDDNLTQIQNMKELGPPEVFNIKDAAILKKFRYKSNAEMR